MGHVEGHMGKENTEQDLACTSVVNMGRKLYLEAYEEHIRYRVA